MTLFLIVLVLIFLLLAAAYAAFYFAVVRMGRKPEPGKSGWLLPYREEILAGGQWFRDQMPERITIRSRDGLKLVGYFLPAENAKGTLLLVHGFRSDPWCDFGIAYPFYHSLGWNILTVCQRAHSESEGKYITFGIKERFDVCDWALFLSDRFGPEHDIVLGGISMGSSSVLMALGTELPDNVKGVIADCGFTSPRAEFEHVLKTRMHLPIHPLMDLAQLYAKLFAGFGFDDYSTVTALQQTDVPVLFVHGERDNFVPIRFTVDNYAACASKKLLVTVPDAGHGGSYLFARERCQQTLREFLGAVSRGEGDALRKPN